LGREEDGMKKAKKKDEWVLPDLRRRVDLGELKEPGTYLDVEERAAHRLARAIHEAESDGVAVSWSAQKRAQDFINTNGLGKTLDEATRLEEARALGPV